MSKNPSKSLRRQPQAGGFALVIALTLMSFIVLLLVSMVSLTTVEINATENNRIQNEARQHAQLALLVAMGELQKYAGHDQRVTARADITDADISNPYWTGVWDATDTTQPPAWIISGNQGLTPDDPDYITPDENLPIPSSSNDYVWLVNHSVATDNDRIQAPTVLVTNANHADTGHYAYWVGDESIKAKFNIDAEDNTPAASQTASPTTLSYQFGINQLSTTFAASDLEEDERTGESFSIADLTLLTNDASMPKEYFHDLTASSLGLLTDTRNGGLKKDLTFAFENNGVYTMEFGAEGSADRFFIDDLEDPETGLTGPNWDILRSYYSLYNNVNLGSMPVTPALPDANSALRTDFLPYKHGAINDFWHYTYIDPYQRNNAVHPVLSRLQLEFGIQAELHDDTGKYKIRIEVRPVIGLYNPYNVKLNDAVYIFLFHFNPTITLTAGGNNYEINFKDLGLLSNGSGYMRFIVNTSDSDDGIDFLPGETRLFAPLSRTAWLPGSGYKPGDKIPNVLRNTYSANGKLYTTLYDVSNDSKELILIDPEEDEHGNHTATVEITSIDIGNNAFMNLLVGDTRDTATNNLQKFTKLWQSSPSSLHPTPINMFNPLPPMALSSLYEGEEIATWAFNMQTTRSEHGLRNGIDNNLRTVLANPNWDGFVNGNGNTTLSGFSAQGDKGLLNTPLPPQTYDDDRYSGRWGNSIESAGQGHVVLFDIPQEPLLSIGALQHANLGRYSSDPSLIVGNSYANPRIPLDQTVNEGFVYSDYDVYDLPYLVNDKLWDSYFFSSIDPSQTDAEIQEEIELKTYRNKRYVFLKNAGEMINDGVFAAARNDIDHYHALASYIAINGPFNINSTSVKAWTAVLSSMNSLQIPVYDPASLLSTPTEGNLFFSRLSLPFGDAYQSGEEASYDNFWRGFQELTPAQISNLAEEIVDLIYARGRPFGSLAEFVNRSLVNLPETAEDDRLSGLLQQAIDKTDTNINSSINDYLSEEVNDTQGANPFVSDITGHQGAGAPGHLLQGDILQALGPILTTRSDTFIVRAYGDVRNPFTDEITATAYCEAIVQRIPEPASGDPASIANINNPEGEMGRKFKIVKFKWLTPEEV
ncbi:pilus assembly PilX family protein [Cerasicoccus maritimus]|uniref:pilus assembly PilX family protein n=1 Tax=Cerasicoccus maritimus TaxID=490089 RepID=UPI0028525FD7|nr:hypothetical protein [Cerasicoccus maritimus]